MPKPSTPGRAATAVVALTAAFTVGAVPAAGAGTAPTGEPAGGQQQFCWLNADTDHMQCFGTEAEMNQAMRSSGSSTGEVAPRSSTPQLQTRSFQPGQRVVGKFYRDIDFGGEYLMISRSGGCGDGQHSVNLGEYPGWNDSVSSFIAGSGCRIGLFDNSNLTGDFHGNYRSGSYVGQLNDRASSAHFVAD